MRLPLITAHGTSSNVRDDGTENVGEGLLGSALRVEARAAASTNDGVSVMTFDTTVCTSFDSTKGIAAEVSSSTPRTAAIASADNSADVFRRMLCTARHSSAVAAPTRRVHRRPFPKTLYLIYRALGRPEALLSHTPRTRGASSERRKASLHRMFSVTPQCLRPESAQGRDPRRGPRCLTKTAVLFPWNERRLR